MQQLCAASIREFNGESGQFLLSRQMELPLMGRLDAPSVAPSELVRYAHDFRSACQIAWERRRVKRMTAATLAENTGMYPSHVSEYLSPRTKKPRDMPAKFIPAFEREVGNTIVTQWLALQADLTINEEMQADRRAA